MIDDLEDWMCHFDLPLRCVTLHPVPFPSTDHEYVYFEAISSILGSNDDIGLKSSANNLYKIWNELTAIYLFNVSFQIIKINFEFKI